MSTGTMAQQILAKHSTDDAPSPGSHILVQPDWVLAHDISCYPGIERMQQLGFDTVHSPETVIVVIDHYVPSSSDVISTQQNRIAEWVDEQGIEHFFSAGEGISHNIMGEQGYSLPGSLILGADSHTTTHGAYGAFATGIGHTDIGDIFGTGQLWLRVPESRKVFIDNGIPDGCSAKDLGLAIMDALTAKGAIYESIEYHGPAVEALDLYERRTLSNFAVELGAMAGIVPPDDRTLSYVKDRAVHAFDPVAPDSEATYDTETTLDAAALEPLVAKPSKVDNIDTVENVAGTAVDQVFLGTCNNSSYEDIAAFADIIEGEQIDDHIDLIIVPGTRETLTRLNDEGQSNAIIEAGGMIGTPGCGPCFGAHGGILGEGDVCLGTMNRNFPGRMGPGEIYLASPETAAATALYGEITDPRGVI